MWRLGRLISGKKLGQAMVFGGTGALAYYAYGRQTAPTVGANTDSLPQ